MNSKHRNESNTDKKYRELLFRFSLGEIKESLNSRVLKYEFACPFCSAGRKSRNQKKKSSALFWADSRGCFKFHCFNAGSPDCQGVLEFPQFLERLNPALFRAYQRERFHDGTTGVGWNCPSPYGV